MAQTRDFGSWTWLPRTFASTQWSLVRRAHRREADHEEAVEAVCRLYWRPLYVFLRQRGSGPEEAEDHVQSFMVRLLEKGWLEQADRRRGRLRTFLCTILTRHVSAERARQSALKRGGGQARVPFDQELAEKYSAETKNLSDLDPAEHFKRLLALEIFDQAMAALRARYDKNGQSEVLEALLPALEGPLEVETYGDLGRSIGKNPTAVKVAVMRMRERFRAALREAAAAALGKRPGPELDEEVRQLFS